MFVNRRSCRDSQYVSAIRQNDIFPKAFVNIIRYLFRLAVSR